MLGGGVSYHGDRPATGSHRETTGTATGTATGTEPGSQLEMCLGMLVSYLELLISH